MSTQLTDGLVFIFEPAPVVSLYLKRHEMHSFCPSCPYDSLQKNKYKTLKTEFIPKNVRFWVTAEELGWQALLPEKGSLLCR